METPYFETLVNAACAVQGPPCVDTSAAVPDAGGLLIVRATGRAEPHWPGFVALPRGSCACPSALLPPCAGAEVCPIKAESSRIQGERTAGAAGGQCPLRAPGAERDSSVVCAGESRTHLKFELHFKTPRTIAAAHVEQLPLTTAGPSVEEALSWGVGRSTSQILGYHAQCLVELL